MSKLGLSLGWLIHRQFGRASPSDKTALTGNQADDACSNSRWINSPGCKRDFCWVRMVTAVRVPSVLAASSCFTPISIGSAMISVALLGSGSRKVAWMFQISHSSEKSNLSTSVGNIRATKTENRRKITRAKAEQLERREPGTPPLQGVFPI